MIRSIEEIAGDIKSMVFSFDEVVDIVSTLIDDLEKSSESPDVKRCAKWFKGRIEGLILREAAGIAYDDPARKWTQLAGSLARKFQKDALDPKKRQENEEKYQEFLKTIKHISTEEIIYRVLYPRSGGHGTGA